VGLRARDFPTERVLSRTPLIIRAVDQKHDQKRKRRRGGGKSKARIGEMR
jgi:hypothetical protein